MLAWRRGSACVLVRELSSPPRAAQVDPEEHARRQAAEARTEAKRAQQARECAGMRSIASFFGAPKRKPG